MKKLAILTMLVILTLLVMSPIVLAAGYGAMRAPVAFNPGCNTGACGAMANIVYPPPVQQTIIERQVIEQPIIQRTEVITQRNITVQQAPIVYQQQAQVYKAPIVRQRQLAPGCGYADGCASGTVVRTPRVFVGSSGFGTNVQVGRVGVQAAAGQEVTVRRGGLRGVLFGTRVRVR